MDPQTPRKLVAELEVEHESSQAVILSLSSASSDAGHSSDNLGSSLLLYLTPNYPLLLFPKNEFAP